MNTLQVQAQVSSLVLALQISGVYTELASLQVPQVAQEFLYESSSYLPL